MSVCTFFAISSLWQGSPSPRSMYAEIGSDGAHEEQKLREVLQAINIGKASTIHLTLTAGRKVSRELRDR